MALSLHVNYSKIFKVNMNQDRIVILGASENQEKASYVATKLLYNRGYDIYALNEQKGNIGHIKIHDFSEILTEADTITVFFSPLKQKSYYAFILALRPKRIVFNPETDNPELEELARQHHIKVVKGCTIALLINGMW